MSQSAIITASPDVMSGTPVFAGTRVPVQTLLDYLKAGESIDDFLEGFPTVKREQVIAFLEAAQAQKPSITRVGAQHVVPLQ
ncbi:DUF433 domain-containing protein [Fortiea contorta]|uniref:DUF433 domain-containing protein n=1 Tax=Fortiea contorta TaxID=1892405 RepID=UPI0003460384|nr:DUF433 domain-containing protein [Fortiea contorta]